VSCQQYFRDLLTSSENVKDRWRIAKQLIECNLNRLFSNTCDDAEDAADNNTESHHHLFSRVGVLALEDIAFTRITPNIIMVSIVVSVIILKR